MTPFVFSGIPEIRFGAGKIRDLPALLRVYGQNVLAVTGAKSFTGSAAWPALKSALEAAGQKLFHVAVPGEPSPETVDAAVSAFHGRQIHVVAAIGGGSGIDAGKAISAMLPLNAPVEDFLEGVGRKLKHPGVKVPFVAVPTTAGTGSEATRNAVISHIGPEGFKRSLRHDRFMPDAAVVDPGLMCGCPPAVTAACGMDALCQLIESYVSQKASPVTDALAYSGLESVFRGLVPAFVSGAEDVGARTHMAYGALMSGLTLANAGLGVIHGLASPVGGFFNVPHGVVCGTLLAPAVKMTVRKLREAGGDGALEKFARIGSLFSEGRVLDRGAACGFLVEKLYQWSETLGMPRLGRYGVAPGDVGRIVRISDNKDNPIALDEEEMKNVLVERI